MFISFEGGEGSGKTTQTKILSEFIKNSGRECVLTREPGGGEKNGEIRKILVEGNHEWHQNTEILLHMASRNENLQKIVFPALKENKIVITDRYVDSTVAYQCFAAGSSFDFVMNLHQMVARGFMPDLTFLLDMPEETGLERSLVRMRAANSPAENRYESKSQEFHKKVRQGFLWLAETFPERIVKIDATQKIEKISEQIIEVVKMKM